MRIFVEALPAQQPPPKRKHCSYHMDVTIYDVAREAGVGIGTVSRCMNNHPNVSAVTRARVLSVAKKLSYQPHVYARGLASKKTNAVSLIIPYFTNYFFIEVLRGVQDKAAEVGVELVLYGVNNPAEAEHYLRRSLHRGHVDGVLFFSMAFPESCVAKFNEMNLPLVLVDGYHPQFDSLRVKNQEGAELATSHLIRLGHREIAMINATMETQPAQERLAGYRDALEASGLAFSMDIVKVAPRGRQDGFNKEWGRSAMRDLLSRGSVNRSLTAVFIASDVQAIGALEAARDFGVRIPDDIALVAFDDIELAQHLEITTMRQPMYEMGTLALDQLLARMKDPGAPVTLSTFMPELIIRGTCGARRNKNFRSHEQTTQTQLADPNT